MLRDNLTSSTAGATPGLLHEVSLLFKGFIIHDLLSNKIAHDARLKHKEA